MRKVERTGYYSSNGWDVVYERAIREDGSLFFPEKLTKEFLDATRKAQGSYIFANQYLNQIIPSDEQVFKPEWIRYFETVPERVNRFAAIDPAISLENEADFTALVVVAVDVDGNWYIEHASRHKITPPQIINLCFNVCDKFKIKCLGIEEIAYQKALLYMLDIEMKKRGVVLPVKGISHGNRESKEYRIMGLVPRFEWSRLFLKKGLIDFEDELLQFPRAAHDDLLDATAICEQIAIPPSREEPKDDKPNPNDAAKYESWYRRQLANGRPVEREENF